MKKLLPVLLCAAMLLCLLPLEAGGRGRVGRHGRHFLV